ncbi:MAG: RNA 2',3'-cyclic phosphodiesterase [Bacteroidota bacterium]
MRRTFIAVKIEKTELIGQFIQEIRSALNKEKISWVDPDIMHITLKFLGDTEDDEIPVISRKLAEICSRYKQFPVTPGGLGVFPGLANPRVLWIGLEGTEALSDIRNEIETFTADLGFLTDSKKFSPHLTIGRVKYLRNDILMQSMVELAADISFERQMIQEVVFYESILNSEGPEYLVLSKAVLGV